MTSKLDTILDECLAELRAGATADDCLARYPEHAAALQPLLALAVQVQSLPAAAPDRAAANAGRQRMIEAVRAKAAQPRQGAFLGLPWLRRLQPSKGSAFGRPMVRAAMSVALVFLVIALSAGGLVTAAQESLPGDLLYPVKRTAETVRMSLTFDAAAQQQLQYQLDQERQDEVNAILAEGRSASLGFRGILEHVDTDYWIVGGLKLHLDDQSVILGEPILGAIVAVQALASGDGTLLARQLHVQPSDLVPSPTATPTTIPSSLPPTASPSPTALPTETAEPAPSFAPTPTPTREATPTLSPVPTETQPPEPTDQPAPIETEKPESPDQPGPSETEEPESTDPPGPSETEEPESTDPPGPSETEEPESTEHPDPHETPEPESTDHPETDEPESTRTPDPDETDGPESTPHPDPSATEEDDNSEHSPASQSGVPEPAPRSTATPAEES